MQLNGVANGFDFWVILTILLPLMASNPRAPFPLCPGLPGKPARGHQLKLFTRSGTSANAGNVFGMWPRFSLRPFQHWVKFCFFIFCCCCKNYPRGRSDGEARLYRYFVVLISFMSTPSSRAFHTY
uniref:Putative secreted protein n=1 Tax=Anopheles darlingi TaxID=43151 RepID=A0A2M4DNP8_ANODA